MRFRLAAVGLAAAVATLCACGGRRPPPEPALAEVHSARLRGEMKQLKKGVLSDLSDAARGPTVRQDLGRIAADLQIVATRLPDLVYTLDLDADDRSHFVAFADSLGASAARLGEAAPAAPGPVIQERIDEVTNACSGCHWAFRVRKDD